MFVHPLLEEEVAVMFCAVFIRSVCIFCSPRLECFALRKTAFTSPKGKSSIIKAVLLGLLVLNVW